QEGSGERRTRAEHARESPRRYARAQANVCAAARAAILAARMTASDAATASAARDDYDVAIAGSGLGGSTLACILARRGLRVLLLEAGTHPRFAVGESLVPEFGARVRILADLYDVPEIGHLSNFQSVRHHISANSGVKRN